MLVDANVLLYAVDEESPFHDAGRLWLEEALNGTQRVGLPWMSLTAFVRIATHPRALREPLAPDDAWRFVEEWLGAPAAWVPVPGRSHRGILGRLVRDLDLRGNLVTDAAPPPSGYLSSTPTAAWPRSGVPGDMERMEAGLRGDMAGVRGEMRAMLPRLYVAHVAGMIGVAGLVLAAARFA